MIHPRPEVREEVGPAEFVAPVDDVRWDAVAAFLDPAGDSPTGCRSRLEAEEVEVHGVARLLPIAKVPDVAAACKRGFHREVRSRPHRLAHLLQPQLPRRQRRGFGSERREAGRDVVRVEERPNADAGQETLRERRLAGSVGSRDEDGTGLIDSESLPTLRLHPAQLHHPLPIPSAESEGCPDASMIPGSSAASASSWFSDRPASSTQSSRPLDEAPSTTAAASEGELNS